MAITGEAPLRKAYFSGNHQGMYDAIGEEYWDWAFGALKSRRKPDYNYANRMIIEGYQEKHGL